MPAMSFDRGLEGAPVEDREELQTCPRRRTAAAATQRDGRPMREAVVRRGRRAQAVVEWQRCCMAVVERERGGGALWRLGQKEAARHTDERGRKGWIDFGPHEQI